MSTIILVTVLLEYKAHKCMVGGYFLLYTTYSIWCGYVHVLLHYDSGQVNR